MKTRRRPMEIKQKNGKFIVEEAIINEIKNDKIRKLRIGNTILIIEDVLTLDEAIKPETEIVEEKAPESLSVTQRRNLVAKPKGKILFEYYNNKIYENPLAEIKQGIKNNENKKQIIARLSLYFTGAKYKSLKTYYNMYMRYINNKLPKKPQKAKPPQEPQLQQTEETKPTETKEGIPEKGEMISDIAGGVVHENPLNEMIKSAKTKQDMKDIIRKYYPEVMESTQGAYYSAYRRYMYDQKIMISPIKDYKPINKRRTLKPKKSKSVNRVFYSKSYGRWIKRSEIQKVKNAINKTGYGYQPTFDTIKSETNLPDTTIYSVIKYLKDQTEELYKRYTENNEVIYGLKSQ